MRPLSPDGFADCFKECSRALWCIAAAIVGNPDQAEDVIQEAALVALGKLDRFDPSTHFPAWMSRIVRYVALNHARRRAVRRTVPLETGDPVAVPGRPQVPVNGRGEITPDQRSFDDRLLAALRDLDETARACLLLRVVLEMPYGEISLALDIRPGTAMSHVCRARRLLGARLGTNPMKPAAASGATHG
jgi:RNA polymerase sigma-70 factor (ECF subfamily)